MANNQAGIPYYGLTDAAYSALIGMGGDIAAWVQEYFGSESLNGFHALKNEEYVDDFYDFLLENNLSEDAYPLEFFTYYKSTQGLGNL